MRTFIDLFCGIGGFRLALEKQGLECVFSSDIDIHAQKAYKDNFGELPKGDITEILEQKIPGHDILCAGFPCQSFSISGKQGGISDNRGRLFYEIVRIAKYHKPKILLLENVKNILSISNGKVIKTIEDKLCEIGYNLEKHVLNASHFGIPQSRERVYFIAIRKDMVSSNKPTLCCEPLKKSAKEIYLESILEKEVDKNLIIQRDDIQITKDETKVDYMSKPIRIGILNKGGQGERIYSPKGHAITQSAYGGGVGARTGLYKTEQGVRKLTISECKKVMGFPLNHKVSEGMKGYQQLGNAVIPAMISYVYEGIQVV
ncbi:MAG: DNA cytosine methyltransferase [Defluviitaleaceae bacterium]|nr:DNA cytosine methyltransferase [Defluviitaleaceae bacterium]